MNPIIRTVDLTKRYKDLHSAFASGRHQAVSGQLADRKTPVLRCRHEPKDIDRMQATIWRNSRIIAENNLEARAVKADIARARDDGWKRYAMDRLADIYMHNRKLELENSKLRPIVEQSGLDKWNSGSGRAES